MGRFVFKLPDVGEGTAEAEIVAWHIKVGDTINEDQHMVDVMTDKATVEMTSPVAGKVVSLHGEPGTMAPVGAPLVELEVDGTGNQVTAKSNGAAIKAPPPKPETAKPPVPAPVQPPPQAPRNFTDKPLAAPAVRQRAHELGIELQFVHGSGTVGRITHADLDAFVARGGPSAPASSALAKREGQEQVKLIGLRRKIAEKMQESKRRIPHFAYVEEIDMTELEALRVEMNRSRKPDQPKLTLLPFMMRALVRILPGFPQVNARYDDETGIVTRFAPVHIGIATQTQHGLVVPVVKHAEALDLWQSATEITRLAALTRDGKASRDELAGSTITLTSLGPIGGVVTTPVINHPEVAIIGPNAIIDRPVVRDGMIMVRKMMNLSSSFDHRVVDGYDAAQFIQRVKTLLEHPALMFMEQQ